MNRELSTSWDVFELLTFDHSYLTVVEEAKPAWSAVVTRADKRKIRVYKEIFGYEPLAGPVQNQPEWVRAMSRLAKSHDHGKSNDERNRVAIPALS